MDYLIIEDEVPAQHLIEDLLQEVRPDWNPVACLDSVESAVEWLRHNPHPGVIFMDIQLSDGLSFDILEQVEIESMIIFTTAYDEYAVRAFRVNSIDYLLKPIKRTELVEAVEKYESHVGVKHVLRNKEIDVKGLADAIHQSAPRFRSRFLVSQGEAFYMLPVNDVAFFFSRHRITSAVGFGGRRHVIDFTLEALDEQLDPGMFFRVSRQVIVNINAVTKVHAFFNGKLVLEMEPGFDEKIIISREKARRFKTWLDR